MSEKIKVTATIQAPAKVVYEKWTLPEHIIHWNFATDDWHCPKATNEVKVGGKLCATMAAKNGEMSFDFIAVYSKVIPNKLLVYTMEDGREVEVQGIKGTIIAVGTVTTSVESGKQKITVPNTLLIENVIE